MIKFWTFQSRYTMEELCRTGIYFPDFSKTCKYEGRLPAYNYVLDIYNKINTDIKFRGKILKGLVFGLTEYHGNKLLNIDDYYNAISISPNGLCTSVDEHYLLELNINYSEEEIMSIDFDRFCDLIHYTGIEINSKELNSIDSDEFLVKKNLFKPMLKNGYELKQSHIPYITKDMIINIYPAVEMSYDGKDSNIFYSKCKYLEYYKNKLIVNKPD